MNRPRVGIVIDVDDAWLGGINYYRTLVTAVYADPERAIDIVLFFGEQANPAQLDGFPAVEVVRSPILDRRGTPATWRWRMIKYVGRDVLLQRLLRRHRIDVLSHFGGRLGAGSNVAVIAWIPDFQHLHLPDHFTAAEQADRNRTFAALANASDLVILSSASAQDDLVRMHPAAKARSAVLRFVPDVDLSAGLPTRAELAERHGIEGPYLHLPNQYWAHKNHRVVVEALAVLRDQGHEVRVVSTGSPTDYRNPDHYATLTARIDTLGVGDRYRRLGVVPYRDLIALMRDAVCVINPSLFEGWSTTVEETKAMDRPILLSDIPVHREQAPARAVYFPPHDALALADAMWAQWTASADDDAPAWRGLSPGHVDRRLAFARTYQDIVRRAAAVAPAPEALAA